MAHADLSESIQDLYQARTLTALCQMDETEFNQMQGSFHKLSQRKARGAEVAALVRADLTQTRQNCTDSSRRDLQQLAEQVKEAEANFPIDIMNSYTNSAEEIRLNNEALRFVQLKEKNDCEKISFSDLYHGKKWHETFLSSGWKCIADNYISLSQNLNSEQGMGDAQAKLSDLNKLNLPELKRLFRETFKNGINGEKLKIAFVPQLSWENGALNTTFPYSLLTDSTELTSYRFLIKEFKKLGIPASIIERNSLDSLDNQVKETQEKISKLKSPHLFISRSMGSRVMRELVAMNDAAIDSKISAWFNVGGTPHGSVIAQAKSHPDNFYYGLVPSVLEGLKMPVRFISRDPRIPNHIEATLYSALIRKNLSTMSPIEPRHMTESNVPVLNAIFVRTDHVRAKPTVDPVWMHMLQQGPTEGSAPIHGAAADTAKSMRLIMGSDHLAFWQYTPQEALAIYLRLLIVSAQTELVK